MKNRIIYIAFLFVSILILASCSKGKNDICDPDEICYTDKPDELYVKLEFSNSPNSDPIEVSFYEGYLDDGDLYETFTTTNSSEYYIMPVGKRYTASAKYMDGEDAILVIDSDKLSAISYENCEETCYDWEDEIVLDLKLK